MSRRQGNVEENRKTVGVITGEYFTQVVMGQRVRGVTMHKIGKIIGDGDSTGGI